MHVELRTVRDVMTPDPHVLRADATIADLRRDFERYDFNAFPVIDADGVLRGIVTKLDLLRVFRPDHRGRIADLDAVANVAITELMRPGILTLEPGDPVSAAVDLMLESRLHSLPVVERRRGGPPRLVGIVSRGDLLRHIAGAIAGSSPKASRPRQRAAS